jgi:3-dehydroquinate dehydratase-1
MKKCKVGNVIVGEGEPKICVPLVAKDISGIKEQVQDIVNRALPVDLLELRIDYLEKYDNSEYIREIIDELKQTTDKPVILTFRTGFEGGVRDISREDYVRLILDIIDESIVDLLDVELFTGDDLVEKIVKKAHNCNVKIIMSNHDFNKTPDSKEIVSRLNKMDMLGADIVKIEVMPQSNYDVIQLLSATEEVSRTIDKPIVTMSMSGRGLISRLSGEVFGSAITFGSVKTASAPGQIGVCELKNVLDVVHNNIVV